MASTVDVTAEATATRLSLDDATPTYGERVTATASVTSAHGVPTGTVTFKVGTKSVSAVLSGGQVRAVLPPLPPGTYQVTASFDPAVVGTFGRSTSAPAAEIVSPATSWIVQTVKKARHGKQLRCRIVVRASHGLAVTGEVQIALSHHGRTVRLRTTALTRGIAKARFAAPRQGRWSVVATYRGNATMAGSVAVSHGRGSR